MKMKKILKVVLGVVGSIILIAGIVATVFYIRYKDWVNFDAAITDNDVKTMSLMLQNGYDINDKFFDLSHLKSSIGKGNIIKISTIDYLIQNGADINDGGKREFSPLLFAMAHNRADVFKLLIDSGAKIDIKMNGLNLLEIAIVTDRPEIIKLLPINDFEISQKIGTSSVYQARIVKYMLENRIDNKL